MLVLSVSSKTPIPTHTNIQHAGISSSFYFIFSVKIFVVNWYFLSIWIKKVALVLLSVVAFAAAAPSTTYDHKPAYNHKEYDYVSTTLSLKLNHCAVQMIMMRHLDYRLQLTTTSTTPSRTTTPTSTSVTTSNATETTPRDSTSWFCPTVAVKW